MLLLAGSEAATRRLKNYERVVMKSWDGGRSAMFWVLFLVVMARADQPGDSAAWAVSVLMQLTHMQGWWVPLCQFSGVGRGFVTLCFGAERSPGGDGTAAIPRVQPWFHLVANWQNLEQVHRQLPSGAVTFISLLLCPPACTACQGTGMCVERWMGLVIKYPLWAQPCVNTALVCKLLTPNVI